MKRKARARSSKARIAAKPGPASRREASAYKQDARAPGIVLIGMMGAGKSSVGRCLKKRMGFALFDIDEMIAARFGMPIPQIFATHGERKFRDAETETLRGLDLNRQSIVVTGGGIVLRKQNVDLLKQFGTVVWLDADEETLFERVSREGDRPLLETQDPRQTFSQLLELRRPFYAKTADVRIDTSELTAGEAADAILSKVGSNEVRHVERSRDIPRNCI